MSGFTPGPWSAEAGDHNHRYVLVKDADDRTIYYKYASGTRAEADTDEANACLTAAAPELYEALSELRRICSDIPAVEGNPRFAAANQKALRAISKASPSLTSGGG